MFCNDNQRYVIGLAYNWNVEDIVIYDYPHSQRECFLPLLLDSCRYAQVK